MVDTKKSYLANVMYDVYVYNIVIIHNIFLFYSIIWWLGTPYEVGYFF